MLNLNKNELTTKLSALNNDNLFDFIRIAVVDKFKVNVCELFRAKSSHAKELINCYVRRGNECDVSLVQEIVGIVSDFIGATVKMIGVCQNEIFKSNFENDRTTGEKFVQMMYRLNVMPDVIAEEMGYTFVSCMTLTKYECRCFAEDLVEWFSRQLDWFSQTAMRVL